jgi:hypothetical protein
MDTHEKDKPAGPKIGDLLEKTIETSFKILNDDINCAFFDSDVVERSKEKNLKNYRKQIENGLETLVSEFHLQRGRSKI